jgi:hypothetical protein
MKKEKSRKGKLSRRQMEKSTSIQKKGKKIECLPILKPERPQVSSRSLVENFIQSPYWRKRRDFDFRLCLQQKQVEKIGSLH